MKIILSIIATTTLILSFPGSYSGMYFYDGFTFHGKYISQEEDGEQTNGIGFGFSYLIPQKAINDLDRPTLLSSGTVEMSGFYTRVDSDDEGLYMDLFNAGINCYMQNNIKFGFQYETLLDFGGDTLDEINSFGADLDVNSNSTVFSIGFYKDGIPIGNEAFPVLFFLDYMNLDYDFSSTASVNGNVVYDINDSGSTNLLRFGTGYKINTNLIIQPTVTMNEDKEKRYSIGFLYKL